MSNYRNILNLILGLFCCLLASGQMEAQDEFSSGPIDFNHHIRPIFVRHCTSCHGGVKQAGGLSLVYEDAAMDAIEPGDSESSYLFERVIDEDDESRMPPAEHGPRLKKQEVELLRAWIDQGAKWGKHWAYGLPRRHTVDELSKPKWPLQPIDHFVLQQLDRRETVPAEDERPERWLRRVTLDLIGLPPTLEQRWAFLKDLESHGEEAYATVVDRLLSSPGFGERWASVWFDQVRYADSRGQGEDSPRIIWKYRDWVIDALNADMPYDQFTIKQLAGDLLPNRSVADHLATSVHRLTHTNEEGGTDDEEFRIEAVLDRVNTTWQTWQGTTFGCVQCHHHPYDPFEHEEYYKFVAYFNNTADADLSDDWPTISVPVQQDDYPLATKLQTEINALTRSIWKTQWDIVSRDKIWNPLRISKANTSNKVKLLIDKKDDWDEYYTTGTISKNTEVKIEMPLPKTSKPMTGIRITGLPLDPESALSDSEWGFIMSSIEAELIMPAKGAKLANPSKKKLRIAKVYGDEPFPRYDPNESLNSKSVEGFGAYTRIHHARSAALVLKDPVKVPAGSTLKLSIKHRVFELAAFPLLTRRAHFSVSFDKALTKLLTNKDVKADQEKLTLANTRLKAVESTTIPVLNEREKHLARPSHVFVRGLFLTKDKQVKPDVPKSLRAVKSPQPLTDRLEMANWFVSENNPLTARVAVNRFWARMFGTGLVATEEDFGSTGETPSHPELLDDLAIRFRDDYQWSIKKLIRELALSRTYRQSSRIRPELLKTDSNNRWLHRGPRHSLPAETVRDQMLAISGLISDKMYGPPVHPPLPPGVWKARRGTWKTPKTGNADRYRRSVYTYVKRSVPFPISTTFDAPSRDFCQPKRLRSNTPLQPLMLLNDAGFVECADAFANRMRAHASDLKRQIEYGLLVATCREPSNDEVQCLIELHQQIKSAKNDDLALQSVASVILNLDEVITK